MSQETQPTVAIACQGGGSHTAFTAGVLDRLLRDNGTDYQITAFSGTSGGAVCALAAWYGLRTADTTADGNETAQALLEQVWDEIKATQGVERVTNLGVVQLQRFAEMGLPIPQVAPSRNPFTPAGEERFRAMLETIADEEAIEALVRDPPGESTDSSEPPGYPWLCVSAVDAITGSFEIFSDWPEVSGNPAARAKAAADGTDAERAGTATGQIPFRDLYRELLADGRRPLTLDGVVASAAVPTLFRGVQIENDDDGIYWDGLFSQNPPIRNLLRGIDDSSEKPDEIWLVRINPTVHRRALDDLEDIFDRRNELSGSLSLYQELYHIRRLNEWLEDGKLEPEEADAPAGESGRYKPITVRLIELDATAGPESEVERPLTPASKLDRRPVFIEGLKTEGRAAADQFLRSYRDGEQHNVIVGADEDDA